MYNVHSAKAEEFINHQEILDTIAWAEENKNNKEAAKKSVSIGGGAGGDNARKHCSFL